MPDEKMKADILAVNTAFYQALESMDLVAMADIWMHSVDAVCVHPGWEIITGWDAIRESLRAIFADTGYMRFQASDVQLWLHGETARLTCVENIFSVAGVHSIHGRVACTNLFVNTEEGWKMIVHHGSPIASAQPIEADSTDVDVN